MNILGLEVSGPGRAGPGKSRNRCLIRKAVLKRRFPSSQPRIVRYDTGSEYVSKLVVADPSGGTSAGLLLMLEE